MSTMAIAVRKKKKGKVAMYITFSILALITLLPFYLMLVNATRSSEQIASGFSLIPGTSFIDNWNDTLKLAPIVQGFLNSLFIAVVTTGLSMYFSTMVAYGFSAYNFKFKKIMFAILLASMMIPGQLSFIGFYKLIKDFGLINSYIPLIVPAIAAAGTVFFLKQYADQVINKEVLESARMDGAGEVKIFHRIMLPIFSPAIATMTIFTFIAEWNSFLYPLLVLNDESKYTLPLMVRYINGIQSAHIAGAMNVDGAIYMAIFITTIPILIIFILLSKRIVNGLTTGAVKG